MLSKRSTRDCAAVIARIPNPRSWVWYQEMKTNPATPFEAAWPLDQLAMSPVPAADIRIATMEL